MNSSSHKISIVVSNPRRSQDDEWQTIDSQNISFWKAASSKLAHRRYAHDNCSIDIEFDWAPLARRLTRDYNLLVPLRTGQASSVDWYAKISKPLRLQATCIITGKNRLSGYPWYPNFFLEYYLYEIFFIANLTHPGSAEFFNFNIQSIQSPVPDQFSLSGYFFSDWMIQTVRGQAPAAKLLDIDQTIEWFDKVNPRLTQRAENGTQSAIHATYQLCKNAGQIDFIIWLFNAMESLLGTRVGENFSGLIRRTCLLLDLSDKDRNKLQKTFRKLYDVRSSFIHGGYEVPHPIHSEVIDPRLDEDFSKILDLGSYGFFILGSLFQALIERQIPLIAFEERIAPLAFHGHRS